ncbi:MULTISPECIES: hypothetical protein [Catenuloplanes]|uniref:Uncharacterized protein n=1 Tax=Catenuloplanes niger TaxID=587534 RepID=A0AAE3ZJ06_9ACTN|nr:hypothetical protein [Catenuloplanes niger]MDR7319877.1 hypothetical protein [Catenuloplanes niger]
MTTAALPIGGVGAFLPLGAALLRRRARPAARGAEALRAEIAAEPTDDERRRAMHLVHTMTKMDECLRDRGRSRSVATMSMNGWLSLPDKGARMHRTGTEIGHTPRDRDVDPALPVVQHPRRAFSICLACRDSGAQYPTPQPPLPSSSGPTTLTRRDSTCRASALAPLICEPLRRTSRRSGNFKSASADRTPPESVIRTPSETPFQTIHENSTSYSTGKLTWRRSGTCSSTNVRGRAQRCSGRSRQSDGSGIGGLAAT